MELPVFPPTSVCSECAGGCCRSYAGIAWPEQFGFSARAIADKLLTRKWAVDYWEGDFRKELPKSERLSQIWFVRPAHLPSPPLPTRHPVDPSWGGTCVFLGGEGCRLTEEERPQGCRSLGPVTPMNCRDHSNAKRGAAEAWLPYQSVVEEALRLFHEETREGRP